MSHEWVVMYPGSNLPPNPVYAGNDIDGSPMYVGRAQHEGDLLPAKIIQTQQVAYVSYNGVEIAKHQWEALNGPEFRWLLCSGGIVPHDALVAGTTINGEPLFIGRADHGGCQVPGKVHQSHGCVYYPFDGQECSATQYEVLCAGSF